MYKSFITSLLASMATAAVLPRDSQSPTPFFMVAESSDSCISGKAVNASGTYFWIDKPTSTFCPYEGQELTCTQFINKTAISVSEQEETAYMYANTPGFQQLYLDAAGALRFIPAHTDSIPAGGRSGGFVSLANPANTNLFFLEDNRYRNWYACPSTSQEGPDGYMVYGDVTGYTGGDACSYFSIREIFDESNTPAAWQYT